MAIEALPPALLMILGGLMLPLLPKRAQDPLMVFLPLATLWAVWQIADGPMMLVRFLDLVLEPVRGDAVGRLFASVFSLMAFAGGLFALKQPRVLERAAALVYAGGAVGCALAGDLISLFVFWEIMAVASTLVIWSSDQPAAAKAGMRYALMHLFGGAVLMAGIAGHAIGGGSLDVTAMTLDSPANWLILIGVLVNAGAPPFSAWIADAYPEGSFSGSVFLSAFTTKTAVMVLIKGFPGTELLIWIGLAMVFYGILYALLENDMRRILSYSIVNQVGFMVCAVGIGTDMALNGAAAHAFAHILYKALLLMSAGSVLMMTGGKRKCTELGGLYRSMPITTVCGIIGALAISAFPFTSGFVSKSMIAQGAADQHLVWVWALLQAASAGVFLHAGIKFPWFVFFQKDSGLRPADPPASMRAAMILLAAACIGLGVFPGALYALLPAPTDYQPYTADHLVSQFQLLLFAGLAFFVLLPLMKRTRTLSLDIDWLYRRLLPDLLRALAPPANRLGAALTAQALAGVKAVTGVVARSHGPDGSFGRPWPTGRSVAVILGLLGAYLIFAALGHP
ncbi:Na(+)/H(+) antiporter subunit D [Rhodospirillum rubrum]|uniref:NADH dehydrogenase (Quinone) n=1 Tax=Rhodospirillum rubrum (strain ATCC 11170 / ATH 1.1.1 / DSM 467 / LMG 4362 / NCIMB 8255 / S1) TaxID=269796 RepID=Q2RTW3_RHORT|nr:Na(+)/H(+) antiporter subunit D [Rhodospirillum rubrum]ABC22432.1 NADH dehydrogenase (quinone) [Rhodospirillum rubrum ATCC 11170]AEO48150.1 putative monovalent cation/H+ antiporter subunit D [Rhodospirillum rubrum F11]MBK5954013.1 Na(+)/H(+) antiporter subunit D [Rhodospirillum rubrum]QXG82068.1 Na(+)/H(+) antiporter subunit D [Rhodospirillum rubrum]HAP99362.1 Na(+)/H(+) antiporter subunit D [Rhodospirillum rubrum]